MRTRHRYIPVTEAEVGMLLGAPANDVRGGAMSFSLPTGHALTEENLHQLHRHHVEFIFVALPDLRADHVVADEAAAVAGQVMRIFEGADLADPTMAELFDLILTYRSTGA